MGKKNTITIDNNLFKRKESFVKNTTSEMYYAMNNSCDALNFEWLDKIIDACPFIDQIVRHPKLTLVKEEVVSTIERAKKITSESVKDLAKHSNYINDLDEETVYKFTKALFDEKDNIVHQKAQLLDNKKATQGISIPIHKGAERYYKELGIIK